MSTTQDNTASAPAAASAPAKVDRSYREPLPGGPGYATENMPYEPRGYDPTKYKYTVVNFPARSLWEEMVSGDKCLADYLIYCAMEHICVRGFKKARDTFQKEATIDVRCQKSPDWGKEAPVVQPQLTPEQQLAAMSPEERKAEVARLHALYGG